MNIARHSIATRRHGRRAQRGQAMTEFVVGAVLFLLPMFLIIPTLGKYADVKAASAQAARYVAWERTVWFGGSSASTESKWPGNEKSEEAIQNEARQRVVADRQKVLAADRDTQTFGARGPRHLWNNRDSSSMLANYNDAKTGAIANDSAPGKITMVLGNAFDAVTFLGFDLENKGLYTGNSAIAVRTLPIGGTLGTKQSSGSVFDPGAQFGTGGKLIFRDRNVLLANGWSARGNKHVYDQTRGLTPLGILADPVLKTVVESAGCLVLGAFVPEVCGLELSKIEPEIVPPDRLTGTGFPF